MKLLSFLLCFFLITFEVVQAQEQVYVSGKTLQKTKPSEIGAGYVEVPLDYNDLSQGQIAIYYHMQAQFEANKPTLIFFQGGPGSASRDEVRFRDLDDWNIIFFDYRGIAFSSPDTFDLLRNPRYYSSEATARDAREILNHFGVKKVSVYGHSYGTVLATIFANLFPEMTRTVILEGTVFYGGEELWSSSHRKKILQIFFDRLPMELKKKIIDYSGRADVNPVWFSRVAQQYMYISNFSSYFTDYLEGLFLMSDSEIISSLSRTYDHPLLYEASSDFSEYYFFHVVCQELSGQSSFATFSFKFENEKLVRVEDATTQKGCQQLNIGKNASHPYFALNYPVSVPVTYFQGTTDGATVAPQAIQHYKHVAKSSAQIFLARQGGHVPMHELLVNPDSEDHQKAVELLRMVLNGKVLKKSEFQKFKKDQLSKWVMTSK